MPKIVVMGSYVVDLMSMAEHLPISGETVIGTSFKMGPGGKGSNQAVAAKRAGADVIMLTKVGDDLFGEMAIENFRKEGLQTSYILKGRKIQTGAATIMVDETSGQNKIVVVPGACANISNDDMRYFAPIIKKADVFLTQLETNMDSIENSIEIAYQNNIKIVLNTAPIQPISNELLSKVDIITPNEVEASILTGIEINDNKGAEKAAKVFFEKGIKNVVITLGQNGVFVTDREREEIIPSCKVRTVDTTGAGDAFNGGFVTALAEGKNIFDSAKYANAVAALSVTKLGTSPAMPYKNEIDAFIKGRQ